MERPTDLQSLSVRPIQGEERNNWDQLMATHHYLGFRRLVGESVRYVAQWDLFHQRAGEFKTLSLCLYGKKTTLSYLCLDLLWKPIEEQVRFVLVKDGQAYFILMCSHLNWSPEEVILAYSYRFKIEVSFKYLNHLLGAFYYYFWTSAVPKLSKKKAVVDSTSVCQSQRIAKTMDAIEGFVNFGCIALGILQILASNYPQTIWSKYTGWLRTKRCEIPLRKRCVQLSRKHSTIICTISVIPRYIR